MANIKKPTKKTAIIAGIIRSVGLVLLTITATNINKDNTINGMYFFENFFLIFKRVVISASSYYSIK